LRARPDDSDDAAIAQEARLAAFLERHAGTMPRVMLRYAIENLDKAERDRYLAMNSGG
jgi:hypothetical protein